MAVLRSVGSAANITERRDGIAVVVLDLDQPALTGRCLESISQPSIPPVVVVLVQNGSTSLSETVSNHAGGVRVDLLAPGSNLGCAGGRNLAVQHVLDEYDVAAIVVLDNDAVLTPNFIDRLWVDIPAPLEVFAPVVRNYDDGSIWSVGGEATDDGRVRVLTEIQPEEPQVDWTPGAAFVFSPATWLAVGPLDERLRLFWQDVAWCQRVRDLGGRVVVVPDLEVRHEARSSLGGGWSPQRARDWVRGGVVYVVRIYRLRPWPAARWLAQEVLAALGEFAKGHPKVGLARIVGLAEGAVLCLKRIDCANPCSPGRWRIPGGTRSSR